MSPLQARLLVVDDNEVNRDILSRRLRREGYEVQVADGGRQALAAVEAQRFDLVLLDVMMPEVSGLEVLSVLRGRYSLADLPVIMVTARDQSEDVVEALQLGANDYVTKPIDFPVLTARVRTHLALRQLSELKNEFLGMASHDLKNPLTQVMGTAALVRSLVPPGTPMPERIYKMVSNMELSARKMQTIIEDFLDFQALHDGGLHVRQEPLDLNTLAREAAQAGEVLAQRKEIVLGLELDPELPAALGDRPRLSQVVQNFLDNAIKFCRPGDHVALRTRLEGERAVLEVADSGPGLSEDDLAKVFTKYARLSNRPTGGEKSSGMGLAIAKQFIEQLGGATGVHNNPSGGATFWLALPLAAKEAVGERT